jgi:hypothetical protein
LLGKQLPDLQVLVQATQIGGIRKSLLLHNTRLVPCCALSFLHRLQEAIIGTTAIPPLVSGILQHHASTACAEACAGRSAAPAQAEGSIMGCSQQHQDEQHQQQQQQQQQADAEHPAAAEYTNAVAAAPLCAAACTGAPVAYAACSLTLSGLQQRLKGYGCEQGLAALLDLARIFSQTHVAAADAGQMSAQQLLQFSTDPHQLGTFREQLGQLQQGKECHSTIVYLHGLQQLLAQPVVAAVLGWDSDHQQQRLAEVHSLCRMCKAAAAGHQQ